MSCNEMSPRGTMSFGLNEGGMALNPYVRPSSVSTMTFSICWVMLSMGNGVLGSEDSGAEGVEHGDIVVLSKHHFGVHQFMIDA